MSHEAASGAFQTAWANAIQGHRSAVAAYVGSASRIDDRAWRAPVGPGKWTPAQITEHLARTYQVSLEQIRGWQGLKLRSSFLVRKIVRLVFLARIFRTRRLPRGARAPREIRPADPQTPRATALERLGALSEEFEREMSARRSDEKLRLTHHLFGDIKPLQGVDFIAIHIEHHGRQLTRS